MSLPPADADFMVCGAPTNLAELQRQALEIRDLYDDLSRKTLGRGWTREEFMPVVVGDVGDLPKLAMAA